MTAAIVLAVAVLAIGAALRGGLEANRRSPVSARLPAGVPGAAAARRRWGESMPRPLPSPPTWLEAALVDAAIDVPVGTAWAGWLGAAVVVAPLTALVLGVPAALLATAAVAALPPLVLRSRRGRADRRLETQLPAALESIARSLRTGASVRQAIAEAAAGATQPGVDPGRHRRGRGRLQAELALVAEQAGHGAGLVEALEALATRRPSSGVRLAVAALCLGVDTGGAQARAVDGVAATMRERLAVEAEVRALSSQARISALVIGVAPLGFGAFAAATDPRTSEFLLHTPVGLTLVCVGLLLDGVGWLWMQRLCRVAP